MQRLYQKDGRAAVFPILGWSPHWRPLAWLVVPHPRQNAWALCLGTTLPAGLGTGLSEASRFLHLSSLLCSYLFLLLCAALAGHCALSPLLVPGPR